MPIFRLFLPCVHSNLLTANFILLRLPYFESIMTYCVHVMVVKSLLLFFLISLLLLAQLTIKSCLIDLLPSIASHVLLCLHRFYLSDRIHHVVLQSSSSPPLHISSTVP